MPEVTKRYIRERIKSPSYFDKRSFRIKDIGRDGYTKVIIGCKKGKYNARANRCRIGTETQAFLFDRRDFKR